MSIAVNNFISGLVRYESSVKYYAFGRELNTHIRTDCDVKLPVDSNNNPDWQFIFYINCLPEERIQVPKILKKFNCTFPVLLDEDAKFLKTNKMNEEYTAIGFILDSRNSVVGMGIIGTTMSLFDSEFTKAKRVAR